MKIISKILLLISFTFTLIFISDSNTYAQGCSDAGFCTLQGLEPDNTDTIKFLKNRIRSGVSYGLGDYSVSATSFYLSYYRQFTEEFGIDFKSTALIENGNDINSSGFSDIFITGDYSLNKKTNFVLGVKIPLNNADKFENSLPLPMYYQTSLGTLDIIAGINTNIENLDISFALQQPLSQNDNQFFANEYPSTSIISTFQSTNKFIRKGDILFRASYPFSAGNKFNITPGILPIFHLGNDEFTDTSGVKTEIDGSAGLTFNITLYIDYKIGRNSILQLNAGAPIINRNSKPEGLARSFVGSLNYTFLF